MSVNQVSAYIARALYFSFNGVQLEGVQSFSGLTPTGTVPEIDVSDLSSEERQFEPGIPDPGNTSLSVILDPSTPAYQELVNSSSDGLIYELRVVVGAKGANSQYTDGSPIQTSLFPAASGPAAPAGLTASSGKLSIAKAQAGMLKAVKPGHYIQSGANFGTSTKITGVTTLSTGVVELAHAGNALSLGTNAVRVVKPAWEIRRLAYVAGLGHDGALDAAIMTPLEFRNSGTGATNVGNPSITI